MEEWTQGQKHPETPAVVFVNVYQYDRVRRLQIGRCKKCGQVISSDVDAVKELVFECGDPYCYCRKWISNSSRVHRVCSVCYDMWHSLYSNVLLTNMNYFKKMDDDDAAARKRMNEGGLL